MPGANYFSGSFTHRIDGKGRVSIPARFRALLEDQGESEMMVIPSYKDGVMEAFPRRVLEGIFERLEEKDPQSEEVEDLATYLFGGANTLSFDKDGRVVLSPELQEAIGVTDQVVFMGRADRFYMLSPERSKEVLEAARIRSREKHRGALAPRRRAPLVQVASLPDEDA